MKKSIKLSQHGTTFDTKKRALLVEMRCLITWATKTVVKRLAAGVFHGVVRKKCVRMVTNITSKIWARMSGAQTKTMSM